MLERLSFSAALEIGSGLDGLRCRAPAASRSACATWNRRRKLWHSRDDLSPILVITVPHMVPEIEKLPNARREWTRAKTLPYLSCRYEVCHA
jgi:hypothetical protein